jgi:multidrug efflux pump subunit AcrA (membrane-fusion protein)
MRTQWGWLTAFALVPGAALFPACRPPEPRPVDRAMVTHVLYRCPMHPGYTSDRPGACAICGMNVVAAADEGAGERRTVAGRAAVSLSVDSRRQLGVRVDVVRRTHLYRMLRTLGRVAKDLAPGGQRSVVTEVYETDLTSLSRGMPAALMVAYLPGKAWQGRVTDISPAVDDTSRTFAVRIAVDDRERELRSGMIGDVVLKCDLGNGLMVPDTAVISSGSRRFAFVEQTPDGTLEPREVRLGPEVAFGFQVLSGLAEGDRVVTSANFLIDAEASLRGAAALLAPPPGAP